MSAARLLMRRPRFETLSTVVTELDTDRLPEIADPGITAELPVGKAPGCPEGRHSAVPGWPGQASGSAQEAPYGPRE